MKRSSGLGAGLGLSIWGLSFLAIPKYAGIEGSLAGRLMLAGFLLFLLAWARVSSCLGIRG
jgi:hypothetical protein